MLEEEFYLSIKNNLRKINDVRELFKNLTEYEKEVLEYEKKRAERLKLAQLQQLSEANMIQNSKPKPPNDENVNIDLSTKKVTYKVPMVTSYDNDLIFYHKNSSGNNLMLSNRVNFAEVNKSAQGVEFKKRVEFDSDVILNSPRSRAKKIARSTEYLNDFSKNESNENFSRYNVNMYDYNNQNISEKRKKRYSFESSTYMPPQNNLTSSFDKHAINNNNNTSNQVKVEYLKTNNNHINNGNNMNGIKYKIKNFFINDVAQEKKKTRYYMPEHEQEYTNYKNEPKPKLINQNQQSHENYYKPSSRWKYKEKLSKFKIGNITVVDSSNCAHPNSGQMFTNANQNNNSNNQYYQRKPSFFPKQMFFNEYNEPKYKIPISSNNKISALFHRNKHPRV